MPAAGPTNSRKLGRSKGCFHSKKATWFRKHGVRWRSTIGVHSAERYIENKKPNESLTMKVPDKHPARSKESANSSEISDKDDSESVASRVCSRTRKNGALYRSSGGFDCAKKDIKTIKRASRLPFAKPSNEHTVSSEQPLSISHMSNEDDSEPVVCRSRKRRNGPKTQLNTIGKDVVSQIIPYESEIEDEILIGQPPSKVRRLKSPALAPEFRLFPGPLNEMDIEPSVLKVVNETGAHDDSPIVIGDDDEGHVRLANLTTQETWTALCSLGRKARDRSFSSNLVKAMKSHDGQDITNSWSSPEGQADEPPGPQTLQSASTSTKTISLVDDLREAAAERNDKAFASSTPVSRKTRRRSKSVSPMPKFIFEFSGRPPNHSTSPIEAADGSVNNEVLENPSQKTRRSKRVSPISESSFEDSYQPSRSPSVICDGCLSDEVPAKVELKHQIVSLKHRMNAGQISTTDRKRAFVYDPTPELVLSMKQYIEKTYSMFHKDLDEDDCWLHPSPPAPQSNRGTEGNIQHKFRWTDGDVDYALAVNFGIILLLVQNRLTAVQKEGYVTEGWRVNRTCGNWTCCNWHHLAMETMDMLSRRRSCFGSSEPCRHNPPCLRDKLGYPPRPTQSRRTNRPSPTTSITGAAGSTQLPTSPPSARVMIDRSTETPLSTRSWSTFSITAAESRSQLSNLTLPARAITNRATKPLLSTRSLPKSFITRVENSPQFLSSHPPTTLPHSRERGSLLRHPNPPTRSAFGSGSSSPFSSPLSPRSPRTTRSDFSNESSPRSSNPLPPRFAPTTQSAPLTERSPHASTTPSPTRPSSTGNSSLHTSIPPSNPYTHPSKRQHP